MELSSSLQIEMIIGIRLRGKKMHFKSFILIYSVLLVAAMASLFAGHGWLAGAIFFIAGNFKLVTGVTSSEGGQKKFNIFLLFGFNLCFLQFLFV